MTGRNPLILAVEGCTPRIDPDAYIAPGAVVAGDVTLAAGVSIWFGCVVRSEHERVEIGARTNIQDLTTVHADPGFPVVVGERVTVGHRSVLHGCRIGDDALIGMGAVVMNGAEVGEGAVVGAGAVVTEGTQIAPFSLAVGVPAKVLEGREVPPVPRQNAAGYEMLAEWYRDAEELQP